VPAASPSPRDRYDAGKKLRDRCPRASHARWDIRSDDARERLRPLADVEHGRLPELRPEKRKRMRVSPFAFFRGGASIMARDVAALPRTGIDVQICGDAHVRNLGAYQALDGNLVFDLNDFDETIRGPWEWDVKRLATSLVLAGVEAGQSQARCEESVRLFMRSYRRYLRAFATMRFAALGRHLIARRPGDRLLDQIFGHAERVTPLRNLEKLAVRRAGRFAFHDRRPLLRHIDPRIARSVRAALASYRATLNAGRRYTFERYEPVDVAFKLVGTGSVGTRDYVVLLFGNGLRDPLFIQVKQELPSCYAPYLRSASTAHHEGRRVAEGQQMMQTLSDPFLGYTRFGGHDYLVRQLADHKASFEPSELTRRTLLEYAWLCGEVLAKGHARTGDSALLSGYLGRSPKADEAIAEFSTTYAEQVKQDYRLFNRRG